MFKFLLIVLVVFLVVRLFQSYSKPSSNRNYSSGKNTGFGKKEGEVTVNSNQSERKKRISKNEGEYVDYEDV